ncbi:MAG: inosine/xanthosine triphosphatase [Chloroflexota bacterium]|nr:inosine/xanthosine triphosphatase [Chloroflexota bacterium]
MAVGSLNPVKVSAVSAVIGELWTAAEVAAVAVVSGVRPQPISDHEMIAGALIRAGAARAALDGDLGIGLEGGIQVSAWGYFLTGWVAVIDRAGREGIGSSGRILLPPILTEALEAGEELGPAMDRLVGLHDTRKGPGSVGILTRGLVSRRDAFRTATANAMAPFLRPEWYTE